MAVILRADGSIEQLENRKLKTLQKAVGGYIEPVYTKQDRLMYVNEEGLIIGLPLNVRASDLVDRQIVGDAVYFTDEETRKEQSGE